MSDRVLETLIKARKTVAEPIKPRRKCTEKQLDALALGREKRRKTKE